MHQDAGFDLAFRLREPVPDAPRSCLLLLHGSHGRETALAGLAAGLDPNAIVVFPRGPIELGEGRFTWFNINVTNERMRINPREAEAARRTLLQFVQQIQAAYSIDRCRSIVAGFSQGAAMSASAALTAPEHFAGLGILSGRILAQIEPHLASRERLQQLRAFVGHGKLDKVLPVTLARRSDRWLSDLGVAHVAREYSGGHTIADDMRTDFQSWVEALWGASAA